MSKRFCFALLTDIDYNPGKAASAKAAFIVSASLCLAKYVCVYLREGLRYYISI